MNANTYLLFVTEFDEIEYLPISKSMYPFRMRKSRIIFAAGGLTLKVFFFSESAMKFFQISESQKKNIPKSYTELEI